MSGSSDSITPREAALEALTYFRSRADESKAAKLQRYFKEPVDYYGVDYGHFKEWKADFHSRLREHWTIDDAVRSALSAGFRMAVRCERKNFSSTQGRQRNNNEFINNGISS